MEKQKKLLDLEPLNIKLKSFGYEVSEANGHDIKQLAKYFQKMNNKIKKPTALICHTIKGKGFPFAENNPYWHHKNFFTDKEVKDINKFIEKN